MAGRTLFQGGPHGPGSGYAWTTIGNSGGFNAGSLNIGNDDYTIVAPGTVITGGLSNIPVISNEVFLVLTGFQTGGVTLPLSSISGVVFTWNSTGQFSGAGIPGTPEPSTAGMAVIALVCVFLRGRVRAFRRKSGPEIGTTTASPGL